MERDHARAVKVEQTLHRQLLQELKLIRAATVIQSHARRRAAALLVRQARGWQLQHKLCAQQAAWTATRRAAERGPP